MPSNYEITSVLSTIGVFNSDVCQITPFPCNGKFVNIPTTDSNVGWWSGSFESDAFAGGTGAAAWAVRVDFLPVSPEWNAELTGTLNEFYVWPVRGYK